MKRELQPACTKGIVVEEGGNNKVWCCFSYSGLGELVFIDGSINSEVFKDSSHTLKEYFPFREKFELWDLGQKRDLNHKEHLCAAMDGEKSVFADAAVRVS